MKIAALHLADVILRDLADAFENKDAEAARQRISDGFDGSRFWMNWNDAQWKAAASSLRGATLKSSNEMERVYVLRVSESDRDVRVQLFDGKWLLDYNAFQGPFPRE